MRNETKPIAVRSLEGVVRGPKPLFSGQLQALRAACYFVRCNELCALYSHSAGSCLAAQLKEREDFRPFVILDKDCVDACRTPTTVSTRTLRYGNSTGFAESPKQ